jgi:hypothetical protein
LHSSSVNNVRNAEIAQLVERNLAKVKVAGSRPVFRSRKASSQFCGDFFFKYQNASVVELVDTQDLKSCDLNSRAGSSPAGGTEPLSNERLFCLIHLVKDIHQMN